MKGEWFDWYWRRGLRVAIARRVYSDAFGAGYEYYRQNGRVVSFWLRRNAMKFAAQLNQGAAR